MDEKSKVEELLRGLEQLQRDKERKVKYVIDKRIQQEKLIDALKKSNEEKKGKIEAKSKVLAEKKEPIKKLQQALDASKKEITEANLKKVYSFLERKNNEATAYVMEALIGLLRGMKRADMKSVELYT